MRRDFTQGNILLYFQLVIKQLMLSEIQVEPNEWIIPAPHKLPFLFILFFLSAFNVLFYRPSPFTSLTPFLQENTIFLADYFCVRLKKIGEMLLHKYT